MRSNLIHVREFPDILEDDKIREGILQRWNRDKKRYEEGIRKQDSKDEGYLGQNYTSGYRFFQHVYNNWDHEIETIDSITVEFRNYLEDLIRTEIAKPIERPDNCIVFNIRQ